MLHHAPSIKAIYLAVLIFSGMLAYPQNPLNIFKSEIDSGYIQTFPNALTLKTYIKSKYLNLGVEDQKNGYSLNFKPNGNSSAGFGINYKWIGFGLAFQFINDEETENYGTTEYIDFQTSFYLRKGTFDLFFQKYKGFYLENTAAMVAGWPDDSQYIIRPDIGVMSSGVNYTHVFNPGKFSYISSFSQTEVQKKSAGSIILGATINFHRVSADSSLIPKNLVYDNAFSGNKITSIKGYTTNARFGYAHTLVAMQRFFISLSVDAGLSYVYGIYSESDTKQKHRFYVNPNVSFRFAAGYNYNKWFAGITASGYNHLNKTTNVENIIRIEYGFVNFVIARRIMLEKEIFLPKIK
ncbi:MAG: DUF4421 domain-containing protein [Bacteroidales bacterium]|nr:DUF4421 domain-containing protein [Bacteroidales bacterium]